jgi:GntR family carbon starvation induced transcriptional regulator
MDLAELEETQVSVAADRIMSDIRTGALVAGSKLRIAELRARYGIGASPLREALSMVASLGYATSESHRGYRVAEMSPMDLADITRAREVIEVGMLRESMTTHDDEWAVGIISATERLKRLVAKSQKDGMHGETTNAAHKQLHMALVAGCGSTRLAKMQDLLFDQAARYRDIMLNEIRSPAHFVEIHETLAGVVLSGDIERASTALRDHLNRTLVEVYAPKAGRPG